MTEQVMTKRQTAYVEAHLFVYTNDPYKILFTADGGETAWIRFVKQKEPPASFTPREKALCIKLVDLYKKEENHVISKTDAFREMVKLLPELAKFKLDDAREEAKESGKSDEETTDKKALEPDSELVALREKVNALLMQHRLSVKDLAGAPLDSLDKEHLQKLIDSASSPPVQVSADPKQTRNSNGIIVKTNWTDEQVKLIRRMIARDASDDEFSVFLYVAFKSGLDPLKKQIWFWKQDDEVVIMASIHGKLSKAMDTHQFDGYETRAITDAEGELIAYEAKGWRKDMAHPIQATAYLSEYEKKRKDGSPTKMWAGKKHMMLEKCALSLLLSRMFPEELGGIYSEEEIVVDGDAQGGSK